MKNYFDCICDELKEYFKILSPDIPDFLEEYIDVPEMDRISKISMFCGKDYSKLYGVKYFISNLDHSVGVALILWNFTHDKKQTIAGLYHDIATPVFKHCIDFMNGDSETQESTEEKTIDIIKNSKEIMTLLNRDGISIEEIADYKIYPIADNDAPKLSADRFEYHFSNGLSYVPILKIEDIKKYYQDVEILTNENGEIELGFKNIDVCEEYIHKVCNYWPYWADEKNNVYMQFLGDICKAMNKKGLLSVADLYVLSEKEVIDKIKNCEDKNIADAFNYFQNECIFVKTNQPIKNQYCVKMKSKRRYINPLVKTEQGNRRIYDVSSLAKSDIDGYLSQNYDSYGCFDFDFKI